MRLLSSLLLLTPLAVFAGTAETDYLGRCGKEGLMPQGLNAMPGRKYARDRAVDIKHLALDVTPDFTRRSVQGEVTLTFAPVARPLTTLELDAVDLTIENVSATGAKVSGHQSTKDKLVISLAEPLPAGAEAAVTVRYSCQPENGLYFRTPEQGYPAGDTQVWSQGEAEFHRYWFPCYDYPNDRFTSEVVCHAPDGMEVVSNGKLVSRQRDAAGGLIRWHWKQEQPHVNYLMALAAGYFHRVDAQAGKTPMSLMVPPSEKDQAVLAFRDTQAIMKFYEEETGTPYPWDKYYQVYCQDFLAGGMENTTCSFMACTALFPKEAGELDTTHRLDAHELAHQWFGDLLTCRDWSHLWLNEGFASYYTVLYEGVKNGPDGMALSLWREAQRVINSNDVRPIVWRDYAEPMEQFDSRAYPKGAWVLHMLRSQLGPDLYRASIKE
ncbi:MAG TPA: M1 family metallopeptidase, partial [Verrucomicrobiales bacterium]|nr:M1 family metallopeptidase [Verrucomicrobiales bacterium]